MSNDQPTQSPTSAHQTAGGAIERLVDIMAKLRSPGGCPWDLEQDMNSLRPYLIEEAYEVLEAIDSGDVQEHRKELGDLLLQVVFQARLREEEKAFAFADVANAISDKLVHRHPHVFGDVKVSGSDEVLVNWALIKEQERRKAGQKDPSAVDGVPRALPSLVRSERLGEKASHVGFDWTDAAQVKAKVMEELAEVDVAVAAGDPEAIEEEMGDALFAMAQFSRFLGVHPEDALRSAASKFEARFRSMEKLARSRGSELRSLNATEMDGLWNEIKRQ